MLQLKPYLRANAGMAKAVWAAAARPKTMPKATIRCFFTAPSSVMPLFPGDRLDVGDLRVEAVQGFDEGHQGLFFAPGQAQRHHERVEVRVFPAAAVVEFDQGLQR